MTNFLAMYTMLWAAIANALDVLPALQENNMARILLETALKQTEAMYDDMEL